MLKLYFAILLITLSTCQNTAIDDLNFEKRIKAGANVYVEGKRFSEVIDFTEMTDPHVVGDDQSMAYINSAITFKNCTFERPVICYNESENGVVRTHFAKNVSFIDCVFKEGLSARGLEVVGRVDFSRSIFEGSADFRQVSFKEVAAFKGCTFLNDSKFQYASFWGNASFIEAEFESTAHFQGTDYRSSASFQVAKFYGAVDFSLAKFKEDVTFGYALFQGKSIFSESRCDGKMIFVKAEIKESMQMHDCVFFWEPDLRGVENRDLLEMKASNIIMK